jgi:hypothetical protein
MSLRLRIASFWMPGFLMNRELERITIRTNTALDELLVKHGSTAIAESPVVNRGLIEERRAAMAIGHEMRVKALVQAMGTDEAIQAARETLFAVGLDMGKDAKARLGVGDGKEDLERAARIMYDILGIEFEITDAPGGEVMRVTRCALSKHYSREACLMLSAVDEGVVSGLNPRAEMRFKERITGGSPACIALITIKEGS